MGCHSGERGSENQLVDEDRQNTEEDLEYHEFSWESSENVTLPIGDEIIAELEEMEPILYASATWTGDFFGEQRSQVVMFDLTSGESVATIDFNASEGVGKVVDLGDGYYVGFSSGKELIVFDEELNIRERLTLQDDRILWLTDGLVRVIDDELVLYISAVNENWETDSTTDFLRVNFHREEVEVLFEVQDSLRVIDFVTATQILFRDQVTDWEAGMVHISYGLLDLKTGEIELFETNNFDAGWSADINGLYILLSEPSHTDEPMGQALLLNTQEMSTQFVQLHGDESLTARLSFDGQHIVVINERESLFRKYDFNGNIVNEIEINLPDLFPEEYADMRIYMGFYEIIPISANIYSIHAHGFPVLRNIQFIRLQGR